MGKQVKILVKRVGKAPEVITIENKIETMQGIVGGWLEEVRVNDRMVLMCNEEGRLKNLPPNVVVQGHLIVGDCFLCRVNEAGEMVDLHDVDVEGYSFALSSPWIRNRS